LTSDLTGVAGQSGIVIESDGVTLDLNGFSLVGVPGSLHGVSGTTLDSATVVNGFVRNWGGVGIDTQGFGWRIDGVTAIGNTSSGMDLGNGANVTRCVSRDNGGHGIDADGLAVIIGFVAVNNGANGVSCGGVIADCFSSDNGGAGYSVANHTVVRDCVARRNTFDGIDTGSSCVVTGCTAMENGRTGISIGNDGLARDNVSQGNSRHGIQVGGRGHVVGNTCNDNGFGAGWGGVAATGAMSRIEGNHCVNNINGVLVTGSQNVVYRNTVSGSVTLNYNVAPGNALGTILNVSAGGFVSTSEPWANFEH